MCGIVAVFGTIGKKDEEAFKLMLMMDTIRGPHSTGVGSVLRHAPGDMSYTKAVGTPWELMSDSSFNKLMARNHGMLLGHNRWATKGKITNENAHPFIQGEFMGVHNGTLYNQHELEDHKDFDVDSENIYWHMALHGVKPTIKALNGAFALVWYDKNNHVMHAVRNEDRPMHFVFSKDKSTVFFASEPWMLHVALTKAGIEREETIHNLEPKKLLTIPMPKEWMKPLTLMEEEVEFYKKPVYQYHGQKWQPANKGNSNSDKSKSNVVAIGEGKAAKLKKLVGKIVTFEVNGEKKVGGTRIINAEMVTDPSVQIKFFWNGDVKLWSKLLDSQQFFQGRVKSFTGHGDEAYLTIDRRSMEEVPFQEHLALGRGLERDA